MISWLENPPRFLLFTGKGGVGKTSLACATAVALADRGRRVLLVSTDPASNLDEVLDTPLQGSPVPVGQAPGLDAMNINPVEAAARYRERMVAPLRGVLPDAAVRNVEEQLSGACTVEIAGFNEFTRLIGDEAAITGYDHVILDTAPTGHTLRLLALPAAWNDFIADNKTGNSCLGPLSGLKEQRLVYEKAVHTLCDGNSTLVVMVARPDTASLKEAARAHGELSSQGIKRIHLAVNHLFKATPGSTDPMAEALETRCRHSLSRLPDSIRDLPRTTLPFHPSGLTGTSALRELLSTPSMPLEPHLPPPSVPFGHTSLDELIDSMEARGHGAILTMGKGGVGKTTLAVLIAVELARRGHAVYLSTTDPAAHVADQITEPMANLTVSRIDPHAETKAHAAQIMSTTGAQLDDEGRALLEEELQSPCTEEIAVFQAFARTVAQAEDAFVVLDTAPTGHTLLLLDAAEAYHREVLRSTGGSMPGHVKKLLPRLRDPDYTKVIIVTLPEATPVHEASHLQDDLKRAGILPFAWVANQSFATTRPSDPLLQIKASSEIRWLEEISQLATRWTLLPWKTLPMGQSTPEKQLSSTL